MGSFFFAGGGGSGRTNFSLVCIGTVLGVFTAIWGCLEHVVVLDLLIWCNDCFRSNIAWRIPVCLQVESSRGLMMALAILRNLYGLP